MPRNGSGTYLPPQNSWNPAINGALASPGDWMAILNDMVSALTASASADGQTPITGVWNFQNNRISGVGVPIGVGDALRLQQLMKGSNVASATNIAFPIEGAYFEITGTTTISTISPAFAGRAVLVQFQDALTLTNGASFVLPGASNIKTTAGDFAMLVCEDGSTWVCAYYSRGKLSLPMYAEADIPTTDIGDIYVIGKGAYSWKTSVYEPLDINVASLNGGQLAGNRNKIINGDFSINQESKSGTVALAAGAYGHDMWKAGSGGCTYTFSTSNNVTTLTISAGTLLQIIEGANLQSGVHTLSWGGTAQARIDGGTYGSSGIQGTAVGGTNQTIEFGVGTVISVQYEPGTIATPFERRFNELQLCKRYAQWIPVAAAFQAASASVSLGIAVPFTEMRATPTVSGANVVDPSATTSAIANASGATFSVISRSYAFLNLTSTAAGACVIYGYRQFATARL